MFLGFRVEGFRVSCCLGFRVGIMEYKVETTIIGFRVYWGFMGKMEKEMETTIMGLRF